MKKVLMAVGLLVAGTAFATAIKTWTSSETLKAADLNSNFNHIHDSLRGDGHTLIANADIASNAAIAHSKLATAALVPKAQALVGTPGGTACDGAAAAGTACGNFTVATDSTGVTAVKSNGTAGSYRVDLSYSPPDARYVVVASAFIARHVCTVGSLNATSGDGNGTNFTINCVDEAAAAAANVPFSLIVMDNET